jgi:8-oxo-dGTP pyrophosphatase MutT (NUDIX family)
MIYWARPKIVAQASCLCDSETRGQDARATLAAEEHYDIRWCSLEDLEKLSPPMTDAVKWYCRTAMREISQ